LDRIADHKNAAGEWVVDEASLLATYPPPGGASRIFQTRPNGRSDNEKGTDPSAYGK
jgi:hypothetical protein